MSWGGGHDRRHHTDTGLHAVIRHCSRHWLSATIKILNFGASRHRSVAKRALRGWNGRAARRARGPFGSESVRG